MFELAKSNLWSTHVNVKPEAHSLRGITSSSVASCSPQHQISDVEQVAQECAAVILLTGVHLWCLLNPHLSQGVLEHTCNKNIQTITKNICFSSPKPLEQTLSWVSVRNDSLSDAITSWCCCCQMVLQTKCLQGKKVKWEKWEQHFLLVRLCSSSFFILLAHPHLALEKKCRTTHARPFMKCLNYY